MNWPCWPADPRPTICPSKQVETPILKKMMTETSFDAEEVQRPRKSPVLAWKIAGALWLAAVAGGTSFMLDYSETSGVAAKAPLQWPRSSQIVPSASQPTLLMFVHPHCPCSRASLSELD